MTEIPEAAVTATRGGAIPPLRIRGLRLVGPQRDYNVDFTDDAGAVRQLSLIAGEISTGKTSILELIDYCLGAKEYPEHDEIIANVRSARLWIEAREAVRQEDADPQDLEEAFISAQYVIERPVGSVAKHAFLFRGALDELGDQPAELLSLDPADSDSLSQFLLRTCGLAGLRVKSAPTQEESATSILSFRDVKPLWFLTNRRMDNADLVLEKNPPRTLKLRQVVDYFFDVGDEESSAIAQQIEELRRDLRATEAGISALRKFLSDAGIGELSDLDAETDRRRVELAEARVELDAATSRLTARTSFASDLRAEFARATSTARATEAQLRDRQTLLRRLDPLRSQYADDLRKLEMLEESQQLFDALTIVACPACQSALLEPPSLVDGQCSLCDSRLSAQDGSVGDDTGDEGGPQAAATFSVMREQRSVKRRLAQLKGFIGDIATEVRQLETQLEDQQAEINTAQQALDSATASTVAPFIAERDGISARVAAGSARLAELDKTRRMLLQLQHRENHVLQTKSQIKQAVARQRSLEQTRQSRDEMIDNLSARFLRTLSDLGYPKLDDAHLRRNLVPVVRGKLYDRVGSSGAMTLIALAWQLSIYEEAVENGSGHPGFLLIDSPQKNLRRGAVASVGADDSSDDGHADDAAIARNSATIVDRIYAHIEHWLARHPEGQIIVVDNEPPARAQQDVVVEFSADPDDPPYGLIDNEDGRTPKATEAPE